MPYRNVVTPNIKVPAQRGWCLKYVDDSIDAPVRLPSAKASYEAEKRNGNITFDLPVGVWLPGYLSFNKGAYTNLGHVFWIYQHADGRVEIHDSETAAGARKPYSSITELCAWFGAYSPQFIGYTHGISGRHLVEWYEEPTPTPVRKPAKGTATILVQALNVRAEPSTSSEVVATYRQGDKVNYDSYIIANGYVWLSYIGGSGKRRYIAEGADNGNAKDVYLKGGVSR